MPRLTLLLTGLIAALTLASPASAQVLTADKQDAAERPADPGRDIQSFSTTYDPAGAWRVAVRFYGAPTAETTALLRVYLGERAADGQCESQYPNVGLAVWTDPADKGGKVSFGDGGTNVVKTIDEDQRGFTIELTDARLANRAVCGVGTITLSKKESFDSISAFEFAGAPAEPAPGTPSPGGPLQPGAPAPQPGQPAAPKARVMILRDKKLAARGTVRVAVVAANQKMTARATLYGPGNVVLSRHGMAVAPGQMIRLTLKLGTKRLAQLKRTGRLQIRVVTQLITEANGKTIVRNSATLRAKRS
jgi:hypothetical protein